MCVSYRRRSRQLMKNLSHAADRDHLERKLAALSALNVKHLKDRWRSVYSKDPPPRIHRDLLTRALAYRLQERALGSLKPSTRRLLDRVGEDHSSSQVSRVAHRKVAPGTVLIREW